MTKKEFFDGLEVSIGFLTPDERNLIRAYYEKELSDISDTCDVSEHVRIMDLPTSITDRIKNSDTCENQSEVFEDDLIFSRPLPRAKAPEVIHSMEDREVKTLFGEKVEIKNRVEPIEEITLEPIDKANGFTNEEIEKAKAQTLEKTEKFAELDEEPEEEMTEEESIEYSERVMIEEDETSELPANQFDVREKGLFQKLWNKIGIFGVGESALTIFATIIISPILVTLFLLGIGVYVIVVAGILLLSLALLLLMTALIGGGVVELIYGALSLFKSIPIALIELGLGTILFSLVCCFSGLTHQFIFGVLPSTLKKISKFFVRSIKKAKKNLYGGKA